jgi:RNA polymerase sigma factor (sigma-70 family)
MNGAARAKPGGRSQRTSSELVLPEGAQRLRGAFLALLDVNPPVVDELRQLFFADSWYLAEVQRIANHVLRRTTARRDRVDDLAHDALVRLAGNIERRPDLGFDRGRPPADFAPWLRSIIYRHCLQSLRAEWRHVRRRAEFDDARCVAVRSRACRLADDALELLHSLPDPQGTVLKLHFEKCSVAAIACQTRLTRYRVRRMIREGTVLLRKYLK